MGPQAEKGEFDRSCSRITIGSAGPIHGPTLAQPPTPPALMAARWHTTAIST
jgi:hypothetical protein